MLMYIIYVYVIQIIYVSYEGGDGTKAHSEGHLRSVNDEAAGEAVSGGFSYTVCNSILFKHSSQLITITKAHKHHLR